MRINEEKALIQSIQKGDWKTIDNLEEEKSKLRKASQSLKKDARINIRISSKVLELIKKRAVDEGMPYQTLISSLLYKYANGNS